MIKSQMGHWREIKLPSELSDGRPSGMEAGPVITYRLSDEELAKYREGDKPMSFAGKKLNRAALLQRFAAGEGRTFQELQAMGKELGVAATTLLYHRKNWERQQEQAAATAQHETDAAVRATATVPDEPDPGEAPMEDAPEPEPQPDSEPVRKPEPEPAPSPEPASPLPADRPKGPRIGDICEGVVERVEAGFAIVNLPEYYEMGKHRGVKGRVLRKEISRRVVGDARDVLQEGDLVNIKVINITPGWSGKRSYELSIRQAPPHPEQPASLRGEAEAAAPAQEIAEAAPATPEPAPVVGESEQPTPEPEPEQATATGAAQPAQTEPVPTYHTTEPMEAAAMALRTVSLCESCIKADVCPLSDFFGDPTELPEENKPGRLAVIQIEYGPRPVTRCSAYRAEQGATA